MLNSLQCLLGLSVFLLLAWLMSSHKRQFPWRVVVGGLLLQLFLAILLLRTPQGAWCFSQANAGVTRLLQFVDEGSGFLFGINTANSGLPAESRKALLSSFAFGVLPTIIFFSAVMAVLYHLRIMQVFVQSIAWVMQRTLGTSGPETLAAAANVFVGHTEAPLVVKPYLSQMTMSELNAMMTGGFATVTGSLLVGYAQEGADPGHLLAACVISAPASLAIAKVVFPETEPEKTERSLKMSLPHTSPNLIGAATQGASDGLKLALNVGAMLIAFLALIAMVDWPIGQLGILLGYKTADGAAMWSLAGGLSIVFYPFAYLLSVPHNECLACGKLLGVKMVANEFLAYSQLGQMVEAGEVSDRTRAIMTYALAGFSNFGAIGIQVGGIGSLAPDRRDDIARLGLRAMLGGTLACLMTAAVAGLLI